MPLRPEPWEATLARINDRALTEPIPIDDNLCSGIALIEPTWAGVRLVFYSEQTSYETHEPTIVVKAKIVLPLEELEAIATKALRYVSSLGKRMR